ncbi:MAG: magnesium transporter, partial [archaeon]
ILSTHLILAFFIPAILYMSNALGIQNQTLLIRDLATMGKELKLAPYFIKTVLIGLCISLVIGILVYGLTLFIWNDTTIASVIALAMGITLLISSFTSILITVLFTYLGKDPALGSGPFATVISDLTSIIVYFVIVSTLL